jgi:CheY-like chemotaxis protein
MSGIELAEKIKARRPWTPVVIVTGYGSTDNQARAKAAGVSAFLNKPLSPEMIEESAAQALLQTAPVAAVAVSSLAANEEIPVEVVKERSRLVNIALFLAAPFIGLVYAMALPLVGMAMLLGIAGKALAKYPAGAATLSFLKNAGLLLAAPFIGLAYAVALPFIGMGMLLYTGGRALVKMPAARNAALLVTAPFIGLVFAVTLPVVGAAMLIGVGSKAAFAKAAVR